LPSTQKRVKINTSFYSNREVFQVLFVIDFSSLRYEKVSHLKTNGTQSPHL